ncbi:MAG: transcriptional repressor NrdR [Chloroflexi bacterium]|nr:transcriptional repressor NrdR [Chloroflexota bacterium]
MRCPYCADGSSRVLDSRVVGRAVRRRRVCQSCGQRFTTYETLPPPALTVIKRDGRVESYDRSKLLRSLRQACYKRPIPANAVEDVVDHVEAELIRAGVSEVQSRQIADLALSQLSCLDEIGYICYASSVRGLQTAEDLVAEVEALRALQRRRAESRVQMRLQFDLDQPHWN